MSHCDICNDSYKFELDHTLTLCLRFIYGNQNCNTLLYTRMRRDKGNHTTDRHLHQKLMSHIKMHAQSRHIIILQSSYRCNSLILTSSKTDIELADGEQRSTFYAIRLKKQLSCRTNQIITQLGYIIMKKTIYLLFHLCLIFMLVRKSV